MAIIKATGCNVAALLPQVQKYRLLKRTRIAHPSTLTSLPSSRCIVGKDPAALSVLLQPEKGRGFCRAAFTRGVASDELQAEMGVASAGLQAERAWFWSGCRRRGGVASVGLQSADELISAASKRQIEFISTSTGITNQNRNAEANLHLPLVDYHEQQRKGGKITQTIIYFY